MLFSWRYFRALKDWRMIMAVSFSVSVFLWITK